MDQKTDTSANLSQPDNEYQVTRQHVDEQLRESEKLLRAVADFTYDWEYWIDPDWKLIYCSPSCERITGHKPDDYKRDPGLIRSIIHPEDNARMARHFQEETKSHKTSQLTFRIITQSGETRWIGHVCQPVYDNEGKNLGRRVSNRDITEQKLSEKMLEVERNLAVQLSTITDLESALDEVLKAALQVSSVDSGGVYIVDRFSHDLKMAAQKGLLREYTSVFSHIPAASLLAQLISDGKPIYLSHSDLSTAHYLDKTMNNAIEDEGIHSMAIIPVPYKEKIVAALNAISHTHKEIPANSRNMLEGISISIGGFIARIQAEAGLQKNQENLQSLMNSLTDLLFILDSNGRIFYFNSAVQKRLGYSTERLLAMNIVELYPSYWQQSSTTLLAEMLSGKLDTTSISLTCSNGTLIPVETSIMRGEWENKEVLFLVSRDITQHKRYQILEESEARYRSVVEDQTEMICRFRRDGVLSFVNDAFCQFYGKARVDVLGHSYLSFVPEKYRASIENYLASLAKEDPVLISEQYHVLLDGKKIWHQWIYRALFDARGNLSEYQAVGRDITELRRAEEALKKSEIRFRAAAEGSLDAFYILESERDTDGKIIDFIMVDMNSHAEDLFSISRKNMVGKKLGETFPSLRENGLIEKYALVVETGKVLIDSNYIPETEAASGWYQLQVIPLADGVAVSSRNITQFKQVEESYKKAQDDLALHAAAMEQQNKGIKLLNEMSQRLHACTNVGDAGLIFREYAEKLFTGWSGAWYSISDSRAFFELKDTWGETLHHEQVFDPDSCWAMRRRQVNVVDHLLSQFACHHVQISEDQDTFMPYLCVPMTTQGKDIGMVHLVGKTGYPIEETRELAMAAADRFATTLFTLQLDEKLKVQSIYDPLTSLFNSSYMKKALEREIHRAERTRRQVGVMVLDVDHFKNFNAQYGRDAADSLLIQIGYLLKTSVRKEDIVCRNSGDGFTVIVYESSQEEMVKRAEQIREKIKNMKVQYADGQYIDSATVSVGIACYPEHGDTVEKLLQVADTALNRAKEQGRDQVAFGVIKP